MKQILKILKTLFFGNYEYNSEKLKQMNLLNGCILIFMCNLIIKKTVNFTPPISVN